MSISIFLPPVLDPITSLDKKFTSAGPYVPFSPALASIVLIHHPLNNISIVVLPVDLHSADEINADVAGVFSSADRGHESQEFLRQSACM